MTANTRQTSETSVKEERAQVLKEAGVVKGYASSSGAHATVRPEHKSALGIGLLGFVLAVLLICALWATSGVYAHTAHEQGAVTLRESILQAANQCYAIEGAYPASLRYLEDRYGLSVNNADYYVTYEAFASNIAPTVVVKAL